METPGLPIRDLTEAKRVFEKELNWHEKISLVREIAYSRREELCRAYPDLMMIGHGLRQRQSDAGDPEIVDEPCVILAVRKKWQKGALPPEESTTLPEYLIAFCTVDGKRVPCAVPTDIEDGEAYLRTQPQAGSQSILVSGARGTPSGRGTLTCAIARSSNPDRVYALSCRHVFGINATADHQTGHQVSHDDHVFGQSTGIRGPLAAGPHYSMDAQLAEISDHHALSNALGNVRITNILQPGDPVPPIYYILTPNGPVEVQFRGWWENHVISYEGYGRICHDELLYSKCIQGSTQLGDSGSPVVSQLNGGTLLGMHIAISDYLPAAIL